MTEAGTSSPNIGGYPTSAPTEHETAKQEPKGEELKPTEILAPPTLKAPQDAVPDDVQAIRDRVNLLRQQYREKQDALDKYIAANPDKKRTWRTRMVARKSYSGRTNPYMTTAMLLTLTQRSGKVDKAHRYNLRSKGVPTTNAECSTLPESK